MKGLSPALLALVLLLVGGCSSGSRLSEPEAPRLQAGDHAFSLEFDGRLRSYLARIPPIPTPRSGHPVLLAFHGGGGNPTQFRQDAGLDSIADREGMVVLYPAGTGLLDGTFTWNAGPGCCGFARDQDVDDVGFAHAVLDDLVTRHLVDESRIFLTGHSNGSMMAYRIASETPERFGGVVGVAGTVQLPTIQPRGPIPVLHIHSEDDPRAFYFGGTREDRVHPPVADMMDLWAEVNGCDPVPSEVETRVGGPGGPDSGHSATRFQWSCSGPILEHWRLSGVGHSWPGHRVTPVRELIVGPGTTLISAAEEIWKFIEPLY